MVSSSEGAVTRWRVCRRPSQDARLRLFCFPYAGGGALTFRAWGSGLPPEVEVCGIQLPGHGSRIKEPLFARLRPLVREAAAALRPHLVQPFTFFGHSMGALVAFEVARLLRNEHGFTPRHLFVSAARAPQLGRTEPVTYDLPDPELLEALRDLNGTPKEVLAEPELMHMLLPILRADFAVCQTYEYADDLPLECPITAFGGTRDAEVSRESLEAWRAQTTSDFSLHLLPGDHFFLNVEQALLLRVLTQELRPLTERNR